MSKKMRNALLLAKIETVIGTDSVPTGSANAILCRGLAPQPLTQEFVARETVRPWFGAEAQLPSAAYSVFEFEVELAGSGTAGTVPRFDPLMRACGMSATTVASTSVTYALISKLLESTTIYYYLDGILHKGTACQGNMSLDVNARGIPVMKFRFIGLYSVVTDTTVAAPTYGAQAAPVVVNKDNTTFSMHSVSAGMQSFSIDLGNQVGYRNLVNVEEINITDRSVQGSVMIETPAVATKDWWATVRAGTAAAVSLVHGKTAGNIVTIAGPKVQLLSPTYSDQDGISMMQMPVVFQPNAGNDELSIAFT